MNNAVYAIKKNRGGKGDIQVEVKTIDSWMEISITDNGGGIPQEIMPKIFEPFFSTKPPGEGTGLGLSTSFGIMNRLGGEIAVSSKKGTATFILRLPLT